MTIRKICSIIKQKLINNYSILLFYLSFKHQINQEKIANLRNIHSGKRCFIIGNGPSLTPEDLNKIHANGDITFAANKIANIFPKTDWRPTYYCVFDESMPKIIIDIMSETPAERKFFRKTSYLWTRKVKGECVFFNVNGDRKLLDSPLFSNNALSEIYGIATVTYVSMQLAVYMGFKDIYLLGVDNNYSINREKDGTITEDKSIKSYFEGAPEKDNTKCIGAQWETNIAYQAAKKYADEHGIKIYNATRGGKLEIYPRVNFDSLFKTEKL